MEDRKIAELLKGSNEDGLALLFDKYQDLLYRYILHFTKDQYITEELVQDVFIRIWNYRHKIEPDKGIESLVYRTARNICLNHLRDNKKVHVAHHHYSTHMSAVMPAEDHDVLVHKEKEQSVQQAIDDLPEQCRKVFKVSREDGLSYNDIATHMQLSKDTVRNHIINASKRIRLHLHSRFNMFL